MKFKYFIILNNFMGNTQTRITPRPSFGSVNPDAGEKGRPGYFITKNGVKYQGQLIPPLPGENTFQKLNYGYAVSNLRVFCNGKPIPDADPKSFTVISRELVKKNPNFTKLNCVLGKDAKNNKVRWYKFGNKFFEE